MIQQYKRDLRQRMTSERDHLDPMIKERYDQEICDQLIERAMEHDWTTVHCYLPMRSELDISAFITKLLSLRRRVVCPKTLSDRQLQHLTLSGINKIQYGLYDAPYPRGEDIYQGDYDAIIVPGLAFDREGGRLGYGGGYYDTFLHQYSAAYKIGVGYPGQLVREVPIEHHDVMLDEVLIATAI